jgi:phage gp36-like protein
MPTYCTEADLDTEFGATEITLLADRDNDGIRDAGVVAAALDYAHTRVHALIGNRIQALLTDPDKLAALKYPVADLARWRLYGTRATDEVESRAEHALKMLKDLREGLEDLGVTGNSADATAPLQSSIEMRPSAKRWGGGAY